MSDGWKLILASFTGCKKKKKNEKYNMIKEKYIPVIHNTYILQ